MENKKEEFNLEEIRKKAKQFAFSKELDPVLIQTTREKYMVAATRAVEKWVDAFVEKALQMRKV
jgi:hypothetical protein